MGDNGFELGEHGFYDKRDAFETSMRVPLLAWAPGAIKPGTVVPQLVQNIDIAPSILEVAGVKPPADGPKMDGHSFWPLLQGHDVPWRDHILYEYYWERNFPATPTTLALRTDRWKYIYYHGVWDKDGFYAPPDSTLSKTHNLITVPAYQDQITHFRKQLFDEMEKISADLNLPVQPPAAKSLDQRKLLDESAKSVAVYSPKIPAKNLRKPAVVNAAKTPPANQRKRPAAKPPNQNAYTFQNATHISVSSTSLPKDLNYPAAGRRRCGASTRCFLHSQRKAHHVSAKNSTSFALSAKYQKHAPLHPTVETLNPKPRNQKPQSHAFPTRRDFLRTQHPPPPPPLAFTQPARSATNITSDKIKLGLIGCGARGSGALAQALTADSNSEFWAMGDVFREQIDKSLNVIDAQFKDTPGRVNVAEDRKFVGLDAYKKVLDSGVDLVVIATPGGFRPPLLKAAIEAGKHVFCEKPMGVDPTGVRSVMETVKLAKEKNLAIRAGFNMRFEPAYEEAMKRVHGGDIGEIVAIYSTRLLATAFTRYFGMASARKRQARPPRMATAPQLAFLLLALGRLPHGNQRP